MADNKDLKKFRGGIRLESTSAPANAETGALYFDSVLRAVRQGQTNQDLVDNALESVVDTLKFTAEQGEAGARAAPDNNKSLS